MVSRIFSLLCIVDKDDKFADEIRKIEPDPIRL